MRADVPLAKGRQASRGRRGGEGEQTGGREGRGELTR